MDKETMTIDDELLKKARAAGVKLAELERQAQLSKADYHTLIRRLHLAGASLREIAEVLSLSHQRVAQIVDAAGGSWWKRVWRTRGKTPRDMICTFCERPPSEVAKLMAGPNVYICDDCVALARRALDDGRAGAGRHKLTAAPKGAKSRCSFCSKPSDAQRALATGELANICSECLVVCDQILSDRAGG
jgi:hypothetical protein